HFPDTDPRYKNANSQIFLEDAYRLIREWLGDREVEASYAYGDSRGDREMLAWADQAFYRRFD
ncbi:MAG: hypothetical protein AAFU33_15340, partial [Bacteroidota bacterium]